MENLDRSILDSFPLRLKFIVHLEYFDSPLLSLFENAQGDYYLYSWCDANQSYHRWLIFRIRSQTLKRYLQGHIPFDQLILKPVDGFLYIVDLDERSQVRQAYFLEPSNLPELYLPGPNCYYDWAELNPATLEQDQTIIKQRIYGQSQVPLEAP
jgi:hypothetical protein